MNVTKQLPLVLSMRPIQSSLSMANEVNYMEGKQELESEMRVKELRLLTPDQELDVAIREFMDAFYEENTSNLHKV